VGCILFAGELDGNREGLAAQAEIAAALAERDMRSVFAVRSMTLANAVLADSKWDFLQAPRHYLLLPLIAEPRNYVDSLLNRGFGDAHLLAAQADAWQATIRAVKPALLVVCGLPEALLAARLAGLPAIQLSRGFDMPPDSDPLPVLRPWVEQSSRRRKADEALVLGNINALLAAAKRPHLTALHQLFASAVRLLATLPELDPYATRKRCRYVGPLAAIAHGRRLAWPAAAKRRVLVHLSQLPQTNREAVNSILGALERRDSATIALLPGSRAGAAGKAGVAAGAQQFIHRSEVDWGRLLAQADVAVFDGDPQFAAHCALAGVPLICTPQSVEGFQMAGCLTKAGIGAGVGLVAPDLRGRLRAMLEEIESGGEEARAAQALAGAWVHRSELDAYSSVVKTIARLAFIRGLPRRVAPLLRRARPA